MLRNGGKNTGMITTPTSFIIKVLLKKRVQDFQIGLTLTDQVISILNFNKLTSFFPGVNILKATGHTLER